jgi:hypothetical protein
MAATAKALELFMQELIGQASKVCEQRGVHRVEAYHLFAPSRSIFVSAPDYAISRKYAVEHTEVLDFLKELVVGIPDPTNGGQINEADLKAEAKPKRKRKAKAKKEEELEGEEE